VSEASPFYNRDCRNQRNQGLDIRQGTSGALAEFSPEGIRRPSGAVESPREPIYRNTTTRLWASLLLGSRVVKASRSCVVKAIVVRASLRERLGAGQYGIASWCLPAGIEYRLQRFYEAYTGPLSIWLWIGGFCRRHSSECRCASSDLSVCKGVEDHLRSVQHTEKHTTRETRQSRCDGNTEERVQWIYKQGGGWGVEVVGENRSSALVSGRKRKRYAAWLGVHLEQSCETWSAGL